jgi:glycine dehydrogenase subunit 2
MMIEPTESFEPESLDAFITAMRDIYREAQENPALLHHAPYNTVVRRLDEVRAARNPKLTADME